MKNLVIAVVVIAVAFFIYQATTTESTEPKSPQPENSQLEGSQPTKVESSDSAVSFISSAPENAAVFIMEPGDGTTVSSPVTVKFGISNMNVSPAGINKDNSGHHHLLIDLVELPDMTEPLPTTDNIVHFGKGQTETALILEPGVHTLQLLLGNYLHVPHDKPVISKKITITVE